MHSTVAKNNLAEWRGLSAGHVTGDLVLSDRIMYLIIAHTLVELFGRGRHGRILPAFQLLAVAMGIGTKYKNEIHPLFNLNNKKCG